MLILIIIFEYIENLPLFHEIPKLKKNKHFGGN